MTTIAIEQKALDSLKKAVHDLSDGVLAMKRGQIDESTVERIAREVLSGSREYGRQRRSGPMPADWEDDGSGFGVVAPHTIFDVGAPNPEKLASRGRDRSYEIQASYPRKLAQALGAPEKSVRQLQAATDTVVLASTYLDKEPHELEYFRGTYEPLTQAMDTATTAEGIEYVPKELSGSVIERINLELLVGQLFPLIEMPTQPFDIPGLAVARQRTGTLAEQTADTGQTKWKKITPATRKITLTAVKLGVEVLVSKEMEEDAIIAVVPFIEEEVVDYLAGDWEDTLVNGDTTGTHQDSDTTAADDPRKSLMGLRKLTAAGAKTDGANAVLTVAMLRANRSKMGRYGTRIADLAHIVPIRSYINLLSDASVITLEKYGPQATILTGELGKLDGAPLIVSEYVRQDLNATGVYDGVTTNRTLAMTVNRRGFLQGQRRGLTVQVLRELYAESDQDAIVASFRRAFAARFPSTETTSALTYNLA